MGDLRKAAEMALKALEHLHKTGDTQVFDLCHADKVIPALRQALAQPEQEPVAWADKVGAVIPHSHKLFQPDLLKDYTRPLYTAPPKREWVGLTDDETDGLVHSATYMDETDLWHLVILVEERLKEKNNA